MLVQSHYRAPQFDQFKGQFVAAAIRVAPIAADEPTPPPDSPDTGRELVPGNQMLPPVCAYAVQSCGYSLDPGTMTWQPRGPSSPKSPSY